MSSQRSSTAKPKVSPTVKKATTAAASPGKLPSTSGVSDSKGSTEKINKGDSQTLAGQLKDFSKVVPESGQESNLPSDLNGSELSIIKMLEGEVQHESRENLEDKKMREEIFTLKKDLAMKNNLVEKLMTENCDLRREMDELLSTVEDAKDKINSKLKGCNHRIQELEEEIKSLKTENRTFQDQLQRPDQEASSRNGVKGLEEHVENYYSEAKDQMNTFYEKLNQQIAEFMNSSKSQYESFNNVIQNRIEDFKKESPLPKKISGKNESQSVPRSRYSTSARNSTSDAATRNKGSINKAPAATSTHLDRLSSPGASSNRKRVATLHNLNDVVAANRSLNNYGVQTNESLRKSPKGTFTPKLKGKVSFKPNGAQTEA